MRWTLVRCGDCGSHYTARIIDGTLRLTTDDGDCPCGSDAFVELGESPPKAKPSGDSSGADDTL